MNAAHRVTQPEAVSGMLAAIGGAFMGVGAVQTASSQDVWSNPWFDGGFAAVAVGALLVISATSASWWRVLRRRPPVIKQRSRPSAMILEHEPAAANPLELRLVDEDWQLSYRAVWAFGLAVCVTNTTDRPVVLANYHVRSEPGETQHPPFAQEVWDAVNHSASHLTSEHQAELFAGDITVPPHGSVTRWYVDTAYVPLPEKGRPHCTFLITDTLDNSYELDIPARPAKRFRSLWQPGQLSEP
jgi:hypothetical protein